MADSLSIWGDLEEGKSKNYMTKKCQTNDKNTQSVKYKFNRTLSEVEVQLLNEVEVSANDWFRLRSTTTTPLTIHKNINKLWLECLSVKF
jgi:hypothetical protein